MRFRYKDQPKVDVPICPLCGTANAADSRIDRYGFRVGVSLCACGLGYLNPQMTREAYAGFYQAHYRPLIATYENRPHDFDRMQEKQIGYGRHLARSCPQVPSGGQLLDAGGSTGAVAEGWNECMHPPSQVTVLDPSAAELAHASKRGYQVAHGTLEDMVWEGEPLYDVVLCAQTIDHVQDPLLALTHLRSATKAGGWLIMDYVSVDPPIPHLALKMDHPCYWTERGLRTAVERTGWAVTKAGSWPAWCGKKGLLICRTS